MHFNEADSLDYVLDSAWKGVRVLESSASDSSESSSHGFNYDSKYLIEVRDLPWSVSRHEIKDIFKDVNILNGLRGIHFVLDDKNQTSGRALVQLEQLKDFQTAFKYNMHSMDDHYIKGNSKMIY